MTKLWKNICTFDLKYLYHPWIRTTVSTYRVWEKEKEDNKCHSHIEFHQKRLLKICCFYCLLKSFTFSENINSRSHIQKVETLTILPWNWFISTNLPWFDIMKWKILKHYHLRIEGFQNFGMNFERIFFQ